MPVSVWIYCSHICPPLLYCREWQRPSKRFFCLPWLIVIDRMRAWTSLSIGSNNFYTLRKRFLIFFFFPLSFSLSLSLYKNYFGKLYSSINIFLFLVTDLISNWIICNNLHIDTFPSNYVNENCSTSLNSIVYTATSGGNREEKKKIPRYNWKAMCKVSSYE